MPTIKQRVVVKGNQPNDTIVEQIVNYNSLRMPNLSGHISTPSLRPIARIRAIKTPIRESVRDRITICPINASSIVPASQKAIDLFIRPQVIESTVPLYIEVNDE